MATISSLRICPECFTDAVKSGGGLCPGCKEPYKITEWEEVVANSNSEAAHALSLPPPGPGGKLERRLSMVKQSTMNSQSGEFDHNRWLFETKGTYGYGNAIWPDENGEDDDGSGGHGHPKELMSKPWRPLTRKLKIPAAAPSLGAHGGARLYGCGGCPSFVSCGSPSPWLLDQLPKLCPVNRATDLAVLEEKFETPHPNNPTGKSDLPGIDVFVSTLIQKKNQCSSLPNTILSILAADYPVEKLSCYVSDDGGALLTFEAMAEAASFANLWVPFCRKHGIEPRNPEKILTRKGEAGFRQGRRRVKREYDEFKVRINSLPDSIRRRSDAYHAREEIQAMNNSERRPDG
ncbi:Cellulose synthase-like protein D1 [Ananas comosus]|uniref:Cellulose synthase-like protein D1 n=1 Tax=Ananas comosus TaxID=4615 RepID=A0A199VE09_ANACO|nr:Cellulose synthase-like protein D1 [Ananas comosus]